MKKKPAAKQQAQRRPAKTKLVMFWLKSSRGTDTRWPFVCPVGTSTRKIKEALEEWVARILRERPAIDSATYGFRSIRQYTRPQLLAMWKKHCKVYDRIADRRKELSAMLLTPQKIDDLVFLG